MGFLASVDKENRQLKAEWAVVECIDNLNMGDTKAITDYKVKFTVDSSGKPMLRHHQ